MRVGLVHVPLVDQIWPGTVGFIRQGCERCRRIDDGAYKYSTGELEQLCRSGQAYLFIAYEPEPWRIHMASVWRFETYDACVFRCLMMGGEAMALWLEQARREITSKAIEGEARKLVASGRPGWRRLFPKARQAGLDLEVDI